MGVESREKGWEEQCVISEAIGPRGCRRPWDTFACRHDVILASQDSAAPLIRLETQAEKQGRTPPHTPPSSEVCRQRVRPSDARPAMRPQGARHRRRARRRGAAALMGCTPQSSLSRGGTNFLLQPHLSVSLLS